jgi:TetR/AcrR family transcriptional regulator, cholesterol catabolism regulator
MASREAVGRRERRKREVEQRIRRAAAHLFHEKGYAEATVEEIAERADVAKGTLFNYFPRKDSLLLAVRDDEAAAVLRGLGPEDEWQGPAAVRLLRLFVAFAEATERNPQLSRVMVIEGMRSFTLECAPAPVELEVRALAERLVREAQACGEFDSGIEAGAAVSLLLAAYAMTLVEWLIVGGEERSLGDVLESRFQIIFRGLRGSVQGKGEHQ